ncbi:MAG TPA: aminotransferase class V-fold PLP-dependent enzyme [Phycisphaerae bacterium]|nr:aminotransferase class V-fold PLP-dependent enzyme [Phycisphaerae bacterium]HRR85096.1 aminotransferase class V-fold PLP-dependent enzyme [Phycisphaerae bacterium]
MGVIGVAVARRGVWRAYLNNAASGYPKAPGVIEAVVRVLSQSPEHPGRATASAEDVLTDCRMRCAAYLGVRKASRIVLTAGATQALNMGISGLRLKRGSLVVTTVTEHNSVLRPLNHLVRTTGIRLSIVGLAEDGALDAETISKELEREPALVVFNHASNVTGRINDVSHWFSKAKAVGAVTMLDASQTAGLIPVNPDDLHADLTAFPAHKGFHGPPGIGVLYVAEGIDLEPLIVGGTGVRSDLPYQPEDMPARLEAGTPNVPAAAGFAAALDWATGLDSGARERAERVAVTLRKGLLEIPNVKVFDGKSGAQQIGVVSFVVKGWTVEEMGYVLQECYGIACRTGLHCAPLIHRAIGSDPEGTVRFSTSAFTSEEEVAVALDAVRGLAA